MSDVYAFWRASLRGEQAEPMPTIYPGKSADNPQPGLWRVKLHKGAEFVPMQIWLSLDGLVSHEWRNGLKIAGTIDGKPVGAEEIESRWLFAKAVSKADFAHYAEHKAWPGEVAGIGDNSGDLSLAEQISEYASQALGWLRKNGIKDTKSKDTAANYRAELLRLRKEADTQRDAEKRPHLEAGRAVDAKFKPIVEAADSAANEIRDALTVFMREEERREQAERDAKYQAERKAAEAARAELEAQRAKQMRDDPIAALTSPEPELPDLPPPPEPVKVQAGGQRGRKTGLREVTKYVVTDHAKALAFFADGPGVREFIQTLAERACKAGVDVPGVEKISEKVAA